MRHKEDKMAWDGPWRWVSGPHKRNSEFFPWQATACTPAGRKKNKNFKFREDAESWCSEARARIATSATTPDGTPRECDPWDGTLVWFQRLIGKMTAELYLTRDSELRQDLRTVSIAAQAMAKLEDPVKNEKLLEELSKKVIGIYTHRRFGARISSHDAGDQGTNEAADRSA